MANIGDRLVQPESGWKRYDDTLPVIKYEGKWQHYYPTSAIPYGKRYRYTTLNDGSDINAKFSFKFTGTRLRLLTPVYNTHSNSISIYIDGNLFQSSQHPSTIGNSGETRLIFEITGLNEGVHTVEVRNNERRYIALDAIDIDENSILLHPDEVTNIKDLEIGKRIRCHYSAALNKVGAFSRLGEEVYINGIDDFIPPESSDNPRGSFYFICVDHKNEKYKLIADRNIQHSISWSIINTEGIAKENKVLIPLVSWDPLDTGNHITLSNLNLTSRVINGNSRHSKATICRKSGKWYWEIHIDKIAQGQYLDIGVCGRNFPNNPKYIGYYMQNGSIRTDSVLLNNIPYGQGYAYEGATISVLVDIDNNQLEFWRDGVSQGVVSSVNMKELIGEEIFPLITTRTILTAMDITCTVNFGHKPFKYDPPKGYKPLDELQQNNKFYIHLPSSDEWDQYIVNSNLIHIEWNWQNIYSWTSTTANDSATNNKVVRGNTSINTLSNLSDNTSNNTVGFRPVLLINSNIEKFLIEDDSKIKIYHDPHWIFIKNAPVSQEDFLTWGMKLQTVSELTKERNKIEYSFDYMGKLGDGHLSKVNANLGSIKIKSMSIKQG